MVAATRPARRASPGGAVSRPERKELFMTTDASRDIDQKVMEYASDLLRDRPHLRGGE